MRREATLSLVVGNSSGQREFINTVIDSGFDGFLSLPSEISVRLGLPWTIANPATLGDGSEVLFDFSPQQSFGMGSTVRSILQHQRQNRSSEWRCSRLSIAG